MAETEQRYLSAVTRGCYLGVPWRNEVAVYCSDRLAFPHRWTRGSVSFNWVHVINIRASGGRFIDPIPSPLSLVQVLLLAKIETVMEVRIFLEKTFREAYFMYPLSTVH